MTDKSREGIAWGRAVSKGAGEAAEKFIDGVVPKKLQDKVHKLVPVKEFGDQLGKAVEKAGINSDPASRGGQPGQVGWERNQPDDAGLDDVVGSRRWGKQWK